AHWPKNNLGRYSTSWFALTDESESTVEARFFFGLEGEDPGTGSACANLGGWLIATDRKLPQQINVSQGTAIGRPCRLFLEVTADQQIKVGGLVNEIGRGSVEI
ncbi:MAG: PhzF family phenazine biosynthesis protein, partial [Glaciimonas sp.]|nr:PhzF family phenazine biosynthesis protein [Glaciimonas sp.]